MVLLSQQVTDVNETADLVERRILIAAALALLVAALVGWAAALRRHPPAGAAGARRHPHLDGRVRHADRRRVTRRAGPAGAGIRPDADPARAADRARKEFVANASHELRTPLFSLAGFLELLDDEDIDDDTRAEFLRDMREQVSRLTKLATDLLDLSRLDSDAV